MWSLYELLLVIGLLLYLPKAMWRRRLPHRGWSMRLGRYPTEVIERLRGQHVLWVHAVSVGEVQAVQPLLRVLTQAYPDDALVLSTVTPSGFAVASKQLANRGTTVYFPLDLRVCVRAALDVLRPRLLLLVESELWPMVIHLTKARGVPVVVVNGRISLRAFRRYRWIRSCLAGVLNEVDLFLMQSHSDAERLIQLGAPSRTVQVMGSLKWDASLSTRPTPEQLRDLAIRLGLHAQDHVIVAGSTHRGEEEVVLRAFRLLRASDQHACLVIAPRHVERVAEVERLVSRAGWSMTRLSGPPRNDRWQVGLVDTLGQLPHYYGLATVAFIGGSLIPHGGQNPLEAASLGKPIVFGPSMQNFAEIAQQLVAHQAARQLSSDTQLPTVLQELLARPAEAQAMGRRAQELTERSRGVASRTLEALRPLLAKPAQARVI